MFYQEKNTSPNRTTFLNQQTTLLPNMHEEDSMATFKDSLISLEFRIRAVQSQINLKMQRDECFTLMQRKASTSYVKKNLEQLYAKMDADRARDQSNFLKIEQQQKKRINQLKKKLKEVNCRQTTQLGSPLAKEGSSFNFTQSLKKKINKALVKPQQLYLQSNQTMFSMLIDEIKQLKQRDALIQRLIESKHKKTVSLNNQVCRKLQFIEGQLEQTIKYIDSFQQRTKVGSQQHSDPKKAIKKASSKGKQYAIQKQLTSQSQNQAFEMIRLEMLSKSIESVQKQLSHKLNIKDVVPLIKQNLPAFEETMNQIKSYVEQNFESMRKILYNQSEINQEISKANKLGWWHCYQKLQIEQSQRISTQDGLGYILFNKQIMNIIPESLVVQQGSEQSLKITSKGWYLINIHELSVSRNGDDCQDQCIPVWIEINNGVRQLVKHKKLINLSAGSQIRLITQNNDLFVQVQRL